jgi:hypothetical protein
MTPELTALLLTAASIGFVPTVLGPDHYLPFVAMSHARNWSRLRTIVITALCGVGHVLSSVVLGLVGLGAGCVWTCVFRLLIASGEQTFAAHARADRRSHPSASWPRTERSAPPPCVRESEYHAVDTIYDLCAWTVRTSDPDSYVPGGTAQLFGDDCRDDGVRRDHDRHDDWISTPAPARHQADSGCPNRTIRLRRGRNIAVRCRNQNGLVSESLIAGPLCSTATNRWL